MTVARHSFTSRFVKAARLVSLNGWIIALLGIPAALLIGSWTILLFIIVLLACWQALYLVITAVFRSQRGRVRSRLRFHVTSWGITYGVITFFFCLLAFQWGVNLFSLAAAFLVSGLLCSAVLAALSLTRMRLEWNVPRHIFASEPFATEVKLTNEKPVLGAFAVRASTAGGDGDPSAPEHHVWRLSPGRTASVTLRQALPARGNHRLPPVLLKSGFPFGLTETRLRVERREEVLVLPRLGRIHQDALVREKGGEAQWLMQLRRKEEQGEFRSLREYQPGDDPRYIHWPTSARLRKLYVREFERQEMHSVLILLDASLPASVADPDDRLLRLEKAVSFAATLGALLSARNVFFAFASYCPDLVTLPYQGGRGHLFSLLEALALAETTDEHTLTDLLAAVDPRETHGAVCLVSPGLSEAGATPGLDASAICVDVCEPEFDEIFSFGH
ncbi:MAG: DUF58 domain-containing protein [Candidatus Brocadiaceae bacterium]|jgi:uncharacterized protein (DUF58 family)